MKLLLSKNTTHWLHILAKASLTQLADNSVCEKYPILLPIYKGVFNRAGQNLFSLQIDLSERFTLLNKWKLSVKLQSNTLTAMALI